MRRVKDALVRPALMILQGYFRHFPIRRGKAAVWQRIVLRHFAWRRTTLSTTSVFGARFDIRLGDILQSNLYFFGVWEPVITRYLLDRLAPGDIFIDVGANIGYYSLLASRRVGATGKVFAIEAASGTYARLQHNLRLNQAANVTTFHVAVSDAPGEVSIWLHRDGELAGATTLAHVAARRRAMQVVETVAARPLGQIVDPDTIRQARFIKIDVEGAEWAVVSSLRELLPTVSSRTEFIIEVNEPLVDLAGGSVEQLLGCFAAAGFQPFVIDNRYDAGFIARKVGRVELRRLDRWGGRQRDLIFRRAGSGA